MADMKLDLLNDLAHYVGVLSKSLEGTKRADDRPAYTSHLAEAAVIFRLVAEEQAYGRSFLDGEAARSLKPHLRDC